MHTILIIEDDPRSAEWIRIYLKRAGFDTLIASDGITGLQFVRAHNIGLVLLDLMLPGMDGIEICTTLREETEVPVIMLTARDAKSDKLKGLNTGADDYVTKPFDPDELISRINAVLRRCGKAQKAVLTCGPMTLDETTGRVKINGRETELSKIQLAILSAFMRSPEMILSREQLIASALSRDFDGYERAVDTHIKRLRKIIHTGNFQPIKTVYGLGYKLQC